MSWIIIFFLTALPVGLIMWFIYYMNEHEKESPAMLGLLFAGGLLSYALVRFISSLLDGRVYELSAGAPFLRKDWEFFLIAFGMIAVVEEFSKFIILNFLSFKSKKFKYPYDGIVYGVFVSLGFAFVENIMYLHQQGLGIALSRAIFTIPVHAAFGVVMGYYLGLAKACSLKKMDTDTLKLRYMAFFVPLLIHGMYDYICNFNIDGAYYILIGFTVILYILAIYLIHRMNVLNTDYYAKDKYQADDIVMEYKDEEAIHSDNIRQRLFEQEEKVTFNEETKQVQNTNYGMKMFADDDEGTNEND